MQAVIPAAGKGTRLRPLTETKPKALVEIAGRPLLSHIFDRLIDLPITEAVVIIGYRGDQVIEQFGTRYDDLPLTYVRQEEQLGLAHAIAQAESVVEGDFLVFNGDNILGCSLESLYRTQKQDSTDVTLLTETADVKTARTTGVVVINESGQVMQLLEKPDNPPSRRVTTGVYGVSAEFFEVFREVEPSDRGEYELADVIDQMLHEGATVETVELEGWRVNVNEPGDRERASELLEQVR